MVACLGFHLDNFLLEYETQKELKMSQKSHDEVGFQEVSKWITIVCISSF